MKVKDIFFLLAVAASLMAPNAQAACPGGLTCGPATVYEVTVQKVELCTGSDGTSCEGSAVIGSGSLSVDIASVAAGSQIAAFGSFDNLQQGTTYTHLRVTFSPTFNIKGSTADPGNVGGNCNTNGDAGTTAVPLAIAHSQALATSVLAVPAPGTLAGITAPFYAGFGMVHNGTSMTAVMALPAPVVVTANMPSLDIAFRTEEGLSSADSNAGVAGGNCILFPVPPEIDFTIQ